MSNILLVPIHLHALVLDHDEFVVDSTADFRHLPYFNGERDKNPDVANISEDIVSRPFENHLLLEAGIHLHWSLPDALTRARPKPGSPQIQEFPMVPNRWLVTRCDKNDRIEKEWIIESDYLSVTPPAYKSGVQSCVAIPYYKDAGQPFRYLGRRIDLSEADEVKTRDTGTYYPRLTAVGYGEPTFAAFYPNCYSVFGFFEKFTGNIVGRRYYVTGWYRIAHYDPLRTYTSRPALEENLKWTYTSADPEFPSRIVCYARLEIEGPRVSQPNGLGAIAVGNTGSEALSACMAKRLAAESDGLKADYEDQFEAMHLVSSLEHRQLDVAAKLFEARHEKGFTAVAGGTLWTIRPELNPAADETGDASAGITLPDELGHLLNVVNERQAEFDRALQQIESLRVQLFSDWYKYMLCAYPPNDVGDSYPDIDEVASYITGTNEKKDGQKVDGNIASLASLKENLDAKNHLKLALDEAINNLQASLNLHNQPGTNPPRQPQTIFRLKEVSGPRYWEPTEPAILIEGPVATPSKRHGQDGRKTDGLLETQLLTVVDLSDPSKQDLRQKIKDTISRMALTPGGNFAFEPWKGQPWNPFLLDWQVEVFPVEHHSNIDPTTGHYQEDFVVANYELAENNVDLTLKQGKGKTTKAANMYSGRSILTPHAKAQLTQQVDTYIFKEVFPLYYKAKGANAKGLKAKNVPMPRWGRDDLLKQMAEVEKWYMGDEESPLLKVRKQQEDTGLTAFRGRQDLPDSQSLSQSLSGFNDALLMHKQTPQLAVEDPLGFKDYLGFAKNVSDTVEKSIYSAPEPLNDFNPIRSGAMKIHQLRLVDTFGQVKKLDGKKLVTSEPLTNAPDNTLVSLPPRLVQPARVNFRWLAADRNEQEMNDHPATSPICGWVLANHLDDSLMIYDNRGKALGSLVKKNGVTWLSAPGGGGARAIAEIANPHLNKMVKTIQGLGAGFLGSFLKAIDSAVKNIEPENFAQHQDLALLMGRPLALVRASVNLEVKGLPVTHQGWNEFRQNMKNNTRDDNGFSRVKFPIRIGEYRQFNDGTVGYWREDDKGEYEGKVFFAPQSDETGSITDSHVKTHKTPEAMVFYQTVKADPQILSLLVDPRGVVHATTGILPVKAINIPPDQYSAALQAIEITFLSTPIITDAGKIHLPLPDEAGYQWSWLQQDDERNTWSEVSSRGLVRKEDFVVFGAAAADVWGELIAKEWIKLIDQKDPTRASVTAKDERKLLDKHQDKTPQIEDILDRAHINPVNLAAKFSGPQEIREGWLKLSAAKDVLRKP